jgi:hypothetical protein
MRDLDLVDAVITLHEVARLVEERIGTGNLSDDLRNLANRLHVLSIDQGRASNIADEIIKQAKD